MFTQQKPHFMRKLTMMFLLALGSFAYTSASNNYRMDEAALEKAFDAGIEVGFEELYSASSLADASLFSTAGGSGEKTRGGYLVRAFFCGGIALHRYYMGTSRGGMWAMYLCIPVVGGVTACVDFWGAVFSSDFYTKYANNDKYIVWLD
jgi:hypothetical protein